MVTWREVLDNKWDIIIPRNCKVDNSHPGVLLASNRATSATRYRNFGGSKFCAINADCDYFAIDFKRLNERIPGFLQVVNR